MILIADSGSTKTEWIVLNEKNSAAQAFTQGINPYYQQQTDIDQIIVNELLPQLPLAISQSISHIYYYGAGCSNEQTQSVVHSALSNHFKTAIIKIDHDLMAAAKALFGDQSGIASILGTGSNSCLYDGKTITANQPSLGFMIGDEGSGGQIGKELLKQFLYKELPTNLHEAFINEYGITKDSVLEHIYKKPMPNRYAASFTPFVSKHIDHNQMKDLVRSCFTEFFQRHITSYAHFGKYPLGAVGSIAYIFQQQLREVSLKFGIPISTIIQKPMEGLIAYHSTQSHD